MFNFNFVKFMPSEYVLRYKSGTIVQEGTGLSFFYYAPTTSVIVVPIASADVPFVFEEVTSDYQTVTIRGSLHIRLQTTRSWHRIWITHMT